MTLPTDPAVLTRAQLQDYTDRVKAGIIKYHGEGFPGNNGIQVPDAVEGDLYKDDKTGEVYRCEGMSEYGDGFVWANIETGVSTENELAILSYQAFTWEVGIGMEDQCTVTINDTNQLIDFVFSNGGDPSMAEFMGFLDEDPETGEYRFLWEFMGSMGHSELMTTDELNEKAGVYVVPEPETDWASFSIDMTYEPGIDEMYVYIYSPAGLQSLNTQNGYTGGLIWGYDSMGHRGYMGYIPRELIRGLTIQEAAGDVEVDYVLSGATGLKTDVALDCRSLTGLSPFYGCAFNTTANNSDVTIYGKIERVQGRAGYDAGFFSQAELVPGVSSTLTIDLPNLKSVDGEAFYNAFRYGSNVTTVTVSMPSLEKAGAQFMYQAGFAVSTSGTMNFPALTSVGDYFMADCNTNCSVSCPALTTAGGHLFTGAGFVINRGEASGLSVFPALAKVGDYAFSAATTIQTLSLPSLIEAGDYFCYNTKPLTSLKVSSLKFITSSNLDYILSTNDASAAMYTTGVAVSYDYVSPSLATYLPNNHINPFRKLIDVGSGGVNVVQTAGTSKTDVMSQAAATNLVYVSPGDPYAADYTRIRIGQNATVNNTHTIAIGENATAYGTGTAMTGGIAIGDGRAANGAVFIGKRSSSSEGAKYEGSIGLGIGAAPRAIGVMDISSSESTSYGYNGTNYRLLSGLYDGQSANDAATYGQVISYSAINNAGAPTTATVGKYVGQLYYDSTNDVMYFLKNINNSTNPPTYTWATLGGGSGPTVVQSTGTSTSSVMSQNAVTSMVYADPSTGKKVRLGNTVDMNTATDAIAVGAGVSNTGAYAIAVGPYSSAGGANSVAIGQGANAGFKGSVAIGDNAITHYMGEVTIGTNYTGTGYNNSNYRLLTGLYDGQSAHDAVNLGQLQNAIINGGTTAPTTATVGAVGTLYSYVDTTGSTPEPHMMVCTVADTVTPSYTWVDVMGQVANALHILNNGGGN